MKRSSSFIILILLFVTSCSITDNSDVLTPPADYIKLTVAGIQNGIINNLDLFENGYNLIPFRIDSSFSYNDLSLMHIYYTLDGTSPTKNSDNFLYFKTGGVSRTNPLFISEKNLTG